MGKKIYKAMAEILRKRYVLANDGARSQIEWVMQDMAIYFQDRDKKKKFNYDKFMKACGHPKHQIAPNKEMEL